MVDYFGNPDIEGKDLKKHIAISSEPANILAIEYAGSVVLSNSRNKAVNLTTCTSLSKVLGKEQETSEVEVRKSNLAINNLEEVIHRYSIWI